MSDRRRPRPSEVQAQILQALLDYRSGTFAEHLDLVARLGLDDDIVRDTITVLQHQGRVTARSTFRVVYVALTAPARLKLEEAAYIAAEQAAAERATIEDALKTARRAESLLAKQIAQHGSALVPVHLVLQLEDKQAEITQLEQRLRAISQAPSSEQ
ncbi:MAG TPA: hypothetical protein PKK15_07865 [Kouleothrix sp.]|nr:hypothetical protein [Kouleothrix sp.]